ncbi:MAG: NAD(P)H-dependent oxidoreductase subunit E [Coriobacteriia bacterium]
MTDANLEPSSRRVRAVVGAISEERQDVAGELLNVLQEIQREFRYLPEEALVEVARRMGVPFGRVYSLSTFFSSFSLQPVGRFLLEVCDGTACHTLGASRLSARLEEILDMEEGCTSKDGLFTLRKVHCVGACAIAPIVVVDGETFGRVKLTALPHIVEGCGADDE